MIIGPTLSIAAATADPWDALVVGAGPAGALAARQLALAGARTLLVDRCAFPRPKVCGGCVSGRAVSLLRGVGLGDLVAALGGVPLRGMQVQSEARRLRLPLGGGLAVSRARFDAALVRAAIEAGAGFLPETSAVLQDQTGGPSDVRRMRLARRGATVGTASVRAVLAADGLGHSSLRGGGFCSRVSQRARIGLGARCRVFPGEYAPGTVFMAVGNGGYVGLVRVEDGTLNVAAAVDPALLKRHGGPAGAVAAILREAGLPPPAALAQAAWQGTAPLTRQTRPLAASRVFLLGDAAGYVEPFTGEGITWALTAAVAVTPLVVEAATDWHPRLAVQWTRLYRRRIARRQWACRLLAVALRHRRIARTLLGLFSLSPALAGLLTRRISGPVTPHQVSCP